jgi:hypothetical protein
MLKSILASALIRAQATSIMSVVETTLFRTAGFSADRFAIIMDADQGIGTTSNRRRRTTMYHYPMGFKGVRDSNAVVVPKELRERLLQVVVEPPKLRVVPMRSILEKEASASQEFEGIDKLLDSSLAATFPASDALSLTQPGGGQRLLAPVPLLGMAK